MIPHQHCQLVQPTRPLSKITGKRNGNQRLLQNDVSGDKWCKVAPCLPKQRCSWHRSIISGCYIENYFHSPLFIHQSCFTVSVWHYPGLGFSKEALQIWQHSDHSDFSCPICLQTATLPVETNCGHSFCGSCLITYWKQSPWLAAITCPLCRQKVVLLDNISCEKQQDNPCKQIVHDIRDYNKRFSGQPRPERRTALKPSRGTSHLTTPSQSRFLLLLCCPIPFPIF
ncbi:uncharacterized protein LOC142059105 isoform X2 [Phalacrocorax aristotelis]|uniref:uncharacterized protein LOC142059105 isoform X2 n=1 Tax=Phalacrocorax aristotelis TaxID=126867 RepID=UPI003F4C02C3